MLLIAITDDDAEDAGRLKKYVDRYCTEHSLAAVTHVFSDGMEFVRSRENYDIVFLDIQMKTLDGLETARLIRKIGRDSILIFVTNMAQFAIKGYEVDALDFIIKPAAEASIYYVMDKAMKRLSGISGTVLAIRTAEETVSLPSSEITYIEVYDHILVYHTEKKEYTSRGRLSDVLEKLDSERFVLCNRSFIVNLRYVSNISRDYLMIGNTRIPVSRSHRQELMQRFSSFLGDTL